MINPEIARASDLEAARTDLTDPSAWYGGRHPSELSSEEFVRLHRTGSIPESAYQRYQEPGGLNWLGTAKKYPHLIARFRCESGEIEFRQSGKRLAYVALDEAGEIRRLANGDAIYLTPLEIQAKRLSVFDRTIVAYCGVWPVGLVSDEWGAMGVWVTRPHQRRGIGTRLARAYLNRHPDTQIGQMTCAGVALTRAVHRSFLRDRERMPDSADPDFMPLGVAA